MRSVLPFMLLLLFTVGAPGQTCDRSFIVQPLSVNPIPLDPQDLEATLDGLPLQVKKVEILQSVRILILLRADVPSRLKFPKDFQRMLTRLRGIDGIPGNVSLAYGVYAKKIAFSGRFTNDAAELRNNLDELVRKAESGDLGRNTFDLDCLMGSAINYFGQIQPGDSIVEIGGSVSFCSSNPNDWTRNSLEYERHILGNAIRLFRLYFDCVDCPRGLELRFNRTGGHDAGLGGNKQQRAEAWEMLQNLWLGSNRAYLVTVAVPTNARPKIRSWRLGLSASAQSRFGLPPNLPGGLRNYPDLLLCGASPRDKSQLAGADLPR